MEPVDTKIKNKILLKTIAKNIDVVRYISEKPCTGLVC